jgi:Family of unknown function (DUF5941)
MSSRVTLYRDDGPLARALATALDQIRLPPVLWLVLGVAPLLVVAAVSGAGAANGTAAIVVAWLVIAGSASRLGAPGRAAWAIPPLVRLGEYSALLWLAALAGHAGPPAAYALLAVLAFRHYDLVYRLRHQGRPPAGWLGLLALGWEGRVVLAWGLLALGALPAGFYALAVALGVLFVAEAAASWARPSAEEAA